MIGELNDGWRVAQTTLVHERNVGGRRRRARSVHARSGRGTATSTAPSAR